MSFFTESLAGEIRAARRAAQAFPASIPALAAAINHAADCLADLERAEALLDSERASAERARAALDRALQLAEIEAEQQRRADEAAEAAAIAAASGSSATRGYLPDLAGCAEFAADQSAAEIERLRKTIALADEAIREACTLRSAAQPGETAGDTQERWNNAHAIETAAVACRKAARKALAALTVFADKRSPEQIAAAIEATRTEALALKHAIDLEQRDNAQRQIRLAAREAARIAADCAAIEAGKAAKAARKKGGAL